MKKLGLFLLGAIAMFAASCTPEEAPSLSVGDNADVKVASAAVSYTFEFTTNQVWQAASDVEWLVLEQTSGQGGDIKLVASITANNTDKMRYANVSIVAGGLEDVFTLAQEAVKTAEDSKRIDKAAQDITIAVDRKADAVVVNSNASWLKEASAKGTDTAVVLSAEANSSSFARSATVVVTNNGTITTYAVKQGSNSVDLEIVDVTYLGTKEAIYNNDEWEYNSFGEYVLNFKTFEGKDASIVINAEKPEKPLEGIPAGEYTADASGNHTAGSFTVDSEEKYYTVADGKAFIDGTVTVAVENGVYSITATLYESEEKAETYSFEGTIPAIEDDSIGAQVYGVSYYGQYDTYFTADQAKRWNFSVFVSSAVKSDVPYVSYITLNLFAAKDADPSVLPTGEFAFAGEVGKIESKYANGITDYKAGTFTISGNTINFDNFVVSEGTVAITKNSDGTYKFDFNVPMTVQHLNDAYEVESEEKFNFTYVFESVALPAVDLSAESKPILDGDFELGAPASAILAAYWYGNDKAYANGYDLFWGGFMNMGGFGGPTLQFALAVNDADWTYEPRKKADGTAYAYSLTTVTPVATYTFNSTVGDKTVVPCATAYLQNPYTGTKFYISGGTITVESNKMTYDLQATSGTLAEGEATATYDLTSDKTIKVTGSHAFTNYRMSDRHTSKLYYLNIK